MNETLTIALVTLGVVGGSILLLQHIPLGPNFQDGEFRRHLTASEKAILARGDTVGKVHKAYQDVWHSSYDQGPLRVESRGGKTYKFTPYGHWQRLSKQGQLQADFYYPNPGSRDTYWREYLPDGSLDFILYSLPAVLNGDSVTETRMVYFTRTSPQDTAVVTHSFSKGNKLIKGADYLSYDTRGRRPAPQDSKFSR
ncbi:hypothetical protein [Hymenobacter chitinivorans]|uniref:Uncharacterized protein n=1 Tax=Hymenobacter chitinivorans DSM 11115 TaxID=1121954 RepID=A0A2M9BPX5_9BACT|nr:hypothetical protein [Hymenobacter chitinivorans]PJJ60010.1 hypothetical protein CLV45_1435 [Hymenobacter chitinivorans DSM 11115]